MEKLRHANQLLQWSEQRQLNAAQLQQVSERYPLQPAPADWLAQANLILLFGTTVLLSAAVIFFFAYNWPHMHYFTKFALAGIAVLLSGVLAICSAADSLIQRSALFGCSILTGALLALIGQTYQTGADIWQLFASWAALITLLVLVSKSRACYLLWFVILELAASRYLHTRSEFFWLFASAPMILNLTLVNLLLLLFADVALPRLGVKPDNLLLRFSAVMFIVPHTYGAMLGAWDNHYQANLLCYLLLSAGLALRYYRYRRDIFVLALLLYSAIAVVTSLLARLLEFSDGFFAMNLLALFVIGSSVAAALWLKKQLRRQAGVSA
ncbi:DUF2157 domain-containing protein [Rheinheimera sp.]|uniref:DUF2157 domain-containing protein n=1 Tax=Rheinheimera sp. TaxID=1869214 RepID=UPI0023574ED6|nr:DUF2157 domain-containing protein [Rheinheimera sp.]